METDVELVVELEPCLPSGICEEEVDDLDCETRLTLKEIPELPELFEFKECEDDEFVLSVLGFDVVETDVATESDVDAVAIVAVAVWDDFFTASS